MSDQITKLTAALAESERKRVAEQQSMSETVQQIKEQVMNLARGQEKLRAATVKNIAEKATDNVV
ncbi:hypothetical protein H5410_031495 [Solanum commersonii]|uniref:Uncharacterized protein n=1 Tax=Solanum commersonii TaxID=4109 RepID=A0A9J5YJB9_SOLCO|nr:hypothetical protein H5410_031495 [Solanum commersonii]